MSCLYIQQIPAIDSLVQHLSNLDCASLLQCNTRLAKQQASHPMFACRAAGNRFDKVCQGGNLAAVKWLHSNSASVDVITDDAMDFAAAEGHLAVVRWLHENRKEGCTTFAMDWAAKFGYLDVVRWLHENRSEGCTTYAMEGAAANGHLQILDWLNVNRKEGCLRQTMLFAEMNGEFDVVEWLYRNRIDVDWGHLPIAIFKRKGRRDLVLRYWLWQKEQRSEQEKQG